MEIWFIVIEWLKRNYSDSPHRSLYFINLYIISKRFWLAMFGFTVHYNRMLLLCKYV